MQVTLVLALIAGAFADIYMHHPKGANNRLNEQSAERDNANRLYNTQNNNRGGYNVGDKSNNPFDTNNPFAAPSVTYNYNDNSNIQYQSAYLEGSILTWEWTNQHGCGGNEATDPNKPNCNIVLQYMCDTDSTKLPTQSDLNQMLQVTIQDGGNTGTPDNPGSFNDIAGKQASNNANHRGRHESEAYYYSCQTRERNNGLFHADQKLQGNTATYTRQNAGGDRDGLECPEERDYYPYWAPSPWRDVAYLTDHVELCPLILNGSQNTNPVGYCSGPLMKDNTVPMNSTGCAKAKGTWVTYNKNIAPPVCEQVAWSRDNHLGNGVHAQPLTWNWTLPAYADLVAAGAQVYTSTYGNMVKCVARIRYNISTDDYDPWNTNSSQDNDPWNGVISPVQQDPTIDIGLSSLQGLQLAVNTAQYGRTFQDRSHAFYIVNRNPTFAGKTIWNMGVRGKRGNIVQTYPAVEYDFVPNRLHVNVGDLIHLQWTGSNTHNNGAPAGDGQEGDAGEGRTGTDRQNFVLIKDLSENYPIALDKNSSNAWELPLIKCYHALDPSTTLSWLDCAVIAATSGQFQKATAASSSFDPLLNDAPASLVGGLILEILQPPQTAQGWNIFYMCTRNNNFSNRGQKGAIIVNATSG